MRMLLAKKLFVAALVFFASACLFSHTSFAKEDKAREKTLVVFAAASLAPSFQELASAYEKKSHIRIRASFAGSSVLAKQIENGAPADVFLSADQAWMEVLEKENKIDPQTRKDLLGNTLVLVAPLGKSFAVRLEKGFDLPGAFSGKWCTAEPRSVPVGRYAQAALSFFGWWQAMEPRLLVASDVRHALSLVERGECALGVVYGSDARSSSKVEVLGTFPSGSHPPIIYPVAAVKGGGKEALGFIDFLFSQEALSVWEKWGFVRLSPHQ